jgi:Fur family peroxide stress response transcriptional regulator
VRDADALAADLHARGLRVTPQRLLIYSLLAEKPSHPTIEAVHEAVVAVLPTVSLRTVYQALHDLEAMGEIRLVQVGSGPLRVDTKTEPHGHLRCTTCGRLHDADVDLTRLVLPVEQRRGFAVDGAEVIFSGRCPTCADNPHSSRSSSRRGMRHRLGDSVESSVDSYEQTAVREPSNQTGA